MAGLSLVNVKKSYPDGFQAVKDFNLDIQDKEFLILVGPSGCGKSTTLRMIAGLEDISDGEFWIDDQIMNMVEPKNRDLSMVFQNYALYPNMTVFDNMAFSLKVRKMSKEEISERVHEAARILEIEHLLDRRPHALSGGQKQRVAIGSAIVRKPKAFLMDEPLSNLDAKLRSQMRVELSKLHKQLGTTIIYVTHDQVEAMTLGTRIVVMKDGVIQQVAPPHEIYDNPKNKFVAGFIGSPSMNFMNATVMTEDGRVFLKMAGQKMSVSRQTAAKLVDGEYAVKSEQGIHEGKHVILGIRPEDLRESGDEDSKVEVSVQVREMLGAETLIYGLCDGQTVSAKMKPDCSFCVGDHVNLYINKENMKIFDMETEENILYKE